MIHDYPRMTSNAHGEKSREQEYKKIYAQETERRKGT